MTEVLERCCILTCFGPVCFCPEIIHVPCCHSLIKIGERCAILSENRWYNCGINDKQNFVLRCDFVESDPCHAKLPVINSGSIIALNQFSSTDVKLVRNTRKLYFGTISEWYYME